MNSPIRNTCSRFRPQDPQVSPSANPPHTETKPSTFLVPPTTSPFVPTNRELALYALFPAILLFGAAYSVLLSTVNRSTYDVLTQSHLQHDPPSYFASKKNIFNKYYVKIGWAWITAATVTFAALSPKLGPALGATEASLTRRGRVILRYLAVTASWILTTQWFFGPPLIDRSFRWSGGMCHPIDAFSPTGILLQDELGITPQEVTAYSALECRRSGGRWHGGHDISGHVFMLVLGAGFLLQEVGWCVWPREKRAIVIRTGEVTEKQGNGSPGGIGYTGKFALGLVGLNLWMLLMTAIFFHTWFEKFTGLLTASLSLYAIYVVPRFVPAARAVLGVPGLD